MRPVSSISRASPCAQPFAGLKQRLQRNVHLDFRDDNGDGMAFRIADGLADVENRLAGLVEKMHAAGIAARLPQRLFEERPVGNLRPKIGRRGGSENPPPPGIHKEDAAVLGKGAADAFQPVGQRAKVRPLPQFIPEGLPWESPDGQSLCFRQQRQQQGPSHRRPRPDTQVLLPLFEPIAQPLLLQVGDESQAAERFPLEVARSSSKNGQRKSEEADQLDGDEDQRQRQPERDGHPRLDAVKSGRGADFRSGLWDDARHTKCSLWEAASRRPAGRLFQFIAEDRHEHPHCLVMPLHPHDRAPLTLPSAPATITGL